MKKFFLGTFALSLIAALTACDSSGSTSTSPQEVDENSADSNGTEKESSSDSKASDKQTSSESKSSDGIATFDELPNCSKSRDGDKKYGLSLQTMGKVC